MVGCPLFPSTGVLYPLTEDISITFCANLILITNTKRARARTHIAISIFCFAKPSSSVDGWEPILWRNRLSSSSGRTAEKVISVLNVMTSLRNL